MDAITSRDGVLNSLAISLTFEWNWDNSLNEKKVWIQYTPSWKGTNCYGHVMNLTKFCWIGNLHVAMRIFHILIMSWDDIMYLKIHY